MLSAWIFILHPRNERMNMNRTLLLAQILITLMMAASMSGIMSLIALGCWFPRGTEPVFPPRSEPPLSMVF